MEDIKEVKDSVKGLDKRLGKVEQKVAVMEEHNNHIEKLLEQNNQTLEKLNDTMQATRDVMTEFALDLKETNQQVDEVKVHVGHHDQDIEELKEERNFNIVKFMRDNWITIILGGYAVYSIAQHIVK